MAVGDGPKRTPLYRCHLEAGARLVDFAGWEMPVSYSGILAEHLEPHVVEHDTALTFEYVERLGHHGMAMNGDAGAKLLPAACQRRGPPSRSRGSP